MKIVVSDTNILIDLIELDMLDFFFNLPLEITTTDLVLYELNAPKQDKILEAAQLNKIKILSASASQLQKINVIYHNKKGISLTDSEVFYFAKEEKAILLTGDGNLRKFAHQEGLDVKGIIWIFDLFEENKILDMKILSDRIEKLLELNQRLPVDECNKRIKRWTS